MSDPIRVLQVVTHMNRGGLETMLMNYYRHIDRNKVQFDFLVHRNERADYDDEIESLGGKIYRLPRLVPWSISYRKKLELFFRTYPQYRIVHVHQDCLSSVILKVAQKCSIPVRIAHSHSSSQDKDYKYPIKLFYKQFIPKYATALFACGRIAGDWMFGGAPFEVLNNAINTQEYRYKDATARRIREQLAISKEAFVIGHVGRFSPPKNHAFIIDIFAEAVKKDPKAILMLVGDGDLRSDIEDKVKSLGLEDCVVFTGVCDNVNEMMQAMDVFVFPSLYEGLPVSMVEAQASGLPCIISEKVPSDCSIADLVQTISLTESPELWAKQILSAKNTHHRDTYEEIMCSGFDITENAKWLEEYYLSKQKESN